MPWQDHEDPTDYSLRTTVLQIRMALCIYKYLFSLQIGHFDSVGDIGNGVLQTLMFTWLCSLNVYLVSDTRRGTGLQQNKIMCFTWRRNSHLSIPETQSQYGYICFSRDTINLSFIQKKKNLIFKLTQLIKYLNLKHQPSTN